MAEQDQKSIFLAAKFPQLSQELQQLLIADGEIVLAAQVPELIILDDVVVRMISARRFTYNPSQQALTVPVTDVYRWTRTKEC